MTFFFFFLSLFITVRVSSWMTKDESGPQPTSECASVKCVCVRLPFHSATRPLVGAHSSFHSLIDGACISRVLFFASFTVPAFRGPFFRLFLEKWLGGCSAARLGKVEKVEFSSRVVRNVKPKRGCWREIRLFRLFERADVLDRARLPHATGVEKSHLAGEVEKDA